MLIKVIVRFIATRKEMPPQGQGHKEWIVVKKPRVEFIDADLKGKTARADKYWHKAALEEWKKDHTDWETYKIHSFIIEKNVRLTRAIDWQKFNREL